MNSNNNKKPEMVFDFSKFMEATLKYEKKKNSWVLPTSNDSEESKEKQYNPNKEYIRKYGHHVFDRIWIGKRRY